MSIHLWTQLLIEKKFLASSAVLCFWSSVCLGLDGMISVLVIYIFFFSNSVIN